MDCTHWQNQASQNQFSQGSKRNRSKPKTLKKSSTTPKVLFGKRQTVSPTPQNACDENHQTHWTKDCVVKLCILCHVDAPVDVISKICGRTRPATQKKINRLQLRPKHYRYRPLGSAEEDLKNELKFYTDFLQSVMAKHSDLLTINRVSEISYYLDQHILNLKPNHREKGRVKAPTLVEKIRREKAIDRWFKKSDLVKYLRLNNYQVFFMQDSNMLFHGYDFIINSKPTKTYQALKIANEISARENAGRIYLDETSFT